MPINTDLQIFSQMIARLIEAIFVKGNVEVFLYIKVWGVINDLNFFLPGSIETVFRRRRSARSYCAIASSPETWSN